MKTLWERLQPRPKSLSGLKAPPQREVAAVLWERLQPRPKRLSGLKALPQRETAAVAVGAASAATEEVFDLKVLS